MGSLQSKLPFFGNKPDERFDSFVTKFKRVCAAYALSDQRMLDLLPLQLKDKALFDYEDLNQRGEVLDKTFDSVIKSLKSDYYSGQDRMVTHKTLVIPVMGEDQSVSSYYATVRQRMEDVNQTRESLKHSYEMVLMSNFCKGVPKSLKLHSTTVVFLDFIRRQFIYSILCRMGEKWVLKIQA